MNPSKWHYLTKAIGNLLQQSQRSRKEHFSGGVLTQRREQLSLALIIFSPNEAKGLHNMRPHSSAADDWCSADMPVVDQGRSSVFIQSAYRQVDAGGAARVQGHDVHICWAIPAWTYGALVHGVQRQRL
ncbi:unnamed protein product [Phytophthora lilii]|uniref:Unnamed protein product n=1 Tax=Phytophthora lilii TaxID=2077276 RepID=A0A9W7CU49_9STRA|nr:unnamed protein product [Phytophthora lilii]